MIDDRDVVERILRHLGLWEQGVRVSPARAPPEIAEWVIEPCCDDPFPACLGGAERRRVVSFVVNFVALFG